MEIDSIETQKEKLAYEKKKELKKQIQNDIQCVCDDEKKDNMGIVDFDGTVSTKQFIVEYLLVQAYYGTDHFDNVRQKLENRIQKAPLNQKFIKKMKKEKIDSIFLLSRNHDRIINKFIEFHADSFSRKNISILWGAGCLKNCTITSEDKKDIIQGFDLPYYADGLGESVFKKSEQFNQLWSLSDNVLDALKGFSGDVTDFSYHIENYEKLIEILVVSDTRKQLFKALWNDLKGMVNNLFSRS